MNEKRLEPTFVGGEDNVLINIMVFSRKERKSHVKEV